MGELTVNKNLSVTVTKKEPTIHEDAQNLLFQELIEVILPKIKPAIKPATKRFTEWMAQGNIVQIQVVEGKVYVFVIREGDLESFSLKEGTEPTHTYDMEDFIQKILSGEFK